MLNLGRGRAIAPGMMIAAVMAAAVGGGPAVAADSWLVSWAKPAFDPLGADPPPDPNGIAYGDHAVASGVNSIAFGGYATASGDNSIAFGYSALAAGNNSLAMGAYSSAGGLNAMALGISSTASGANTTALGNGSVAAGDNSTAVGVQAVTSGANTTAVGNHAAATGDNSTAMGVQASAAGDNTTAIGNHSTATGDNSTAVGILAKATGDDAMALGNQADAAGVASTAIGTQASATGTDSTAIGNQAKATGDNSLALGSGARAIGDNSIAIGDGSIATAANVVSFGSPGNERRLTNIADGIRPTDAATVRQLNLLRKFFNQRLRAIKQNMRKVRQQAVRLTNASPKKAALSAKKAAPSRAAGNAAPNELNGNPPRGVASKARAQGRLAHGKPAARLAALARDGGEKNSLALLGSTERAAGGRKFFTDPPHKRGRPVDDGGPGTPPPATVTSAQFNQAISSLNARIDDVETHANRGIAAVAAMAPVLMPSQPGKTTVSLGSGYYRGEGALSVSAAYRLNFATPVVLYGSYANGGGEEHVARAGIAVEF